MNNSCGKMTHMSRMDRGFTVCGLTMVAIFVRKVFVVFQTVSLILLELAFSICAVCSLRYDQ